MVGFWTRPRPAGVRVHRMFGGPWHVLATEARPTTRLNPCVLRNSIRLVERAEVLPQGLVEPPHTPVSTGRR